MKKEMAGMGNEAGIISVVFGIISIVIASGVGIIFGLIGLVFAIVQSKKGHNKWARAGKILSIIGIVLGILVIVFVVKYAQSYLGQLAGAA